MALVVNTNVASYNAQNQLSKTNNAMQTAMERLTSGLRINNAKDDAAGMAISNTMNAQIRGMSQAMRNANDGISLAQTVEGSLNATNDILQRMRELGVQAANGTNTSSDQQKIAEEVSSMAQEINRIADSTTFNGKNILKTSGTYTMQVDATIATTGTGTIDISVASAGTLSGLGGASAATLAGMTSMAGASAQLNSQASAMNFVAMVDTALSNINTMRSQLGAVQNRLGSTISNLQNVSENMTAAKSRITDADFAAEVANNSRAQLLQQAGTAMLSQANSSQQGVLSLLR
ncbi:MAG: flagellin [Candidatus Competibacter denitrificans]|jgi:flagellin|uniref:Flagellin n=1 Tax=Candidatus Competibacter denitrificans Run_A_D11 TaxID=1400863 RepID=W6MDR1_9GAMM|nr:flagellin [Candidatus Competibacter denitrificans]CDI03303.1 Flagellin [Candidatus Competibacter denitrificans Run_A_D11]HAS85210.1 flagellin FliC [Candidatus Competibacteraceae bacterium]HRC68916.1 flagellin [Candidatus Competibacter denitrificans]